MIGCCVQRGVLGLFGLLLYVASFDGTAFAQAGATEPQETFRQLDANKDGKLTADEGGPGSQQFIRRLLDMAGKKESDSLSRDEFLKIAEEHRRRNNPGGVSPRPNVRPSDNESHDGDAGLPPLLRALDSNRDGRLSRAELNRLNERFATWDRNRDGQLDAQELRAIEQETEDTRPTGENGEPSAARRESTSPPTGSSGRGVVPRGTSGNRNGNSAASRENGSGTNRSDTPAAGNVQQRLAGAWRGWVVDGRGDNPNGGQMEMELRIEGNRMSAREVGTNRSPQGPDLGNGTFTVSGSGNSGSLDAVGTGGAPNGRDFPGIFELDGDTLKWCVSNRGRNRPRNFETGAGKYYMILRRQK